MYHPQRSRPINQSKPKVLKARDMDSLVEYIRSDKCEHVMLMLGAGDSIIESALLRAFLTSDRPKLVSTTQSNLQRLNLPHPEAVFEINFFRRNPVPFYTLAHELYPGKFRPTITHSFIRLLAEKQLLHTCFTQNIDTLERRAGVPEEKIIEAHGSFASQRCIDCKRPYDDAKMEDHIKRKVIAKCEQCKGYVKPDIVFFGEGLPSSFASAVPNLRKADLLIVIGTSLTVHPFASLTGMVDEYCPRVLINIERVGDFGSRTDDVILLGKCDDIVKKLSQKLGWEDDLNRLWDLTEHSVVQGEDEVDETAAKVVEDKKPERPRDNPAILAAVEARLAKLAVQEEEPEPKKAESTDKVAVDNASLSEVDTEAKSKKIAGEIAESLQEDVTATKETDKEKDVIDAK